MKKISFKVQGSTDEPYNVSINRNGNKIQCVCNCGAGVNKMHCKHWMGVFEGIEQKYNSLSEKQIKEIQSWLSGSDIESAWKEYEKIKEKEIKIKKEILILSSVIFFSELKIFLFITLLGLINLIISEEAVLKRI